MSLDFLNDISAVGLATLIILIICSVIVVSVVIERIYFYKRSIIDHNWLHYYVCKELSAGNVSSAFEFVSDLGGLLPRVFEVGLARAELPQEIGDAAMENSINEQRLLLEKRIPIISTIAVIAPFIGLFGTVVGIMNTFQAVASKGQAGVAVVSAGVAESLVATATGLFVAITAVVFFNYFKTRITGIIADMNLAASRLSEMMELVRQGKSFPSDLMIKE